MGKKSNVKRHAGPHKYRLVDIGYAMVFACSLSDCTHHMPPHQQKLLIGKKSICWQCDTEMVLDEDSLKQEFPTCLSCRANVATETLNELSKI